jgi:3-hydroxyisobutyrate dehydrogenase-like beta-hydroxyacid dehydrogenase
MRIGYLGVGNMGQPMAGKLLDAGNELWVYDVREDAMRPLLERQARQASSPKQLADTCDTVIVSLPTLEIFRRALSGPDGSVVLKHGVFQGRAQQDLSHIVQIVEDGTRKQ